MDQFIKVAARTAGGFFLKEKGEPVLVELIEELVPINLVQRGIVAVPGVGEAEAQNAGFAVLTGAGHFARDGMPRLGPPADLVVVLCCPGQSRCHGKAPSRGMVFP